MTTSFLKDRLVHVTKQDGITRTGNEADMLKHHLDLSRSSIKEVILTDVFFKMPGIGEKKKSKAK